ncbi:type II toxin-antitoxin system VapC family toxin [Bradyrhizobium sp.]|uniref:type II toxin-antitoxin system VapC family toxin n=1 Tax=Bradyrhizobium sp. TaxID=376 RepID=UPI003C53143E
MKTLVVDASVAIKWLVLEDMSDVAKELSGTAKDIVAPRLIMTEVGNALVRKTIQGMLTLDEAKTHLDALPRFLPELMDIDELIERAFENACALRHPIYDLIYVEAARTIDGQLVTADRRFTAKVTGTDLARHVILLSDWRSE